MSKLRTMQEAVESELLLYGVAKNEPEGTGDRKVSVDHLAHLIKGAVKLPRPAVTVPPSVVDYYNSGNLDLAISRIIKDSIGGLILMQYHGDSSNHTQLTPELTALLNEASKVDIPIYLQLNPAISVLDTRAAIDSCKTNGFNGVWVAPYSVTTGGPFPYNRSKTNDVKSYCKNLDMDILIWSDSWWCFQFDEVSELPDLPEFQPGQPNYQEFVLHNDIEQPMVRTSSDIIFSMYLNDSSHLIDSTVKSDSGLLFDYLPDETSMEQSKYGVLTALLLGHEYVLFNPPATNDYEYIPPISYMQLGQLDGQPVHQITSQIENGNYTGRILASIGQFIFDTGIPGTVPVSMVGPHDLFVGEQITKRLSNFKVGSNEDFVFLTEDSNGDLLDWENNVVTVIDWNRKYFINGTGTNPISLTLPLPENGDYWVDIEDINGTFATQPLSLLNNSTHPINGQPIDVELDENYLIYSFRLTAGSGIRMSGR